MKRNRLLAFSLLGIGLICKEQYVSAQSTTATNTWASTNYLGYPVGVGGSLEIKNGAYPINFSTNGSLRAVITSGGDFNLSGTGNSYQLGGTPILWNNNNSANLFVGINAGNSSTTGIGHNTLVGNSADVGLTGGTDNTAMGYQALAKNSTGNFNVSIGSESLLNNGTGVNNVAVGYQALNAVSGIYDNDNTGVGYKALLKLNGQAQDAGGLTAIGSGTLSNIVNDGWQNTAVGYQALNACQDAGRENTAVGSGALSANLNGSNCAAFGDDVLQANISGIRNSAFGSEALVRNVTGSYNSAFGNNAGGGSVLGSSCSNNCFFGYDAGAEISTGSNNVLMGYRAGWKVTVESGNVGIGYGTLYANTASDNCAVGNNSMFANTSGTDNVAIGENALSTNTTSSWSTAVGMNALKSSTANANTALGYEALYTTSTGANNTACGYQALLVNNADNNSAFGFGALAGNTSGNSNVAVGENTIYNTTSGNYNTAIGNASGQVNTTGSNNTFVGYGADASANNLSNATAIGNGAIVNASNKVRIGNTFATIVIEGQTAWTFPSDGRFKNNITEDVKGLSFIKKLRPVNYKFDTKLFDQFLMKNMPDSSKAKHLQGVDYTASANIIHTGFIAQEVQQAAISSGYIFEGVHVPVDANDNYGVAYSQFVVPLVKAVQELSKTTDSLKTVILGQDSVNKSLQNQIDRIVNSCCPLPSTSHHMQNSNGNNSGSNANSIGNTNVDLTDVNSIVLNQNVPNPFAEQTIISFNIPVINNSAQVLFYNNNGMLIKTADYNGIEKRDREN
jgi:hypothetical protein